MTLRAPQRGQVSTLLEILVKAVAEAACRGSGARGVSTLLEILVNCANAVSACEEMVSTLLEILVRSVAD